MKTKALLVSLFLFFGVKSYSTTITTVPLQNTLCTGQYLYLQWTLSDTLSYGTFEIQSSDPTGSFSTSTSFGFLNISFPVTTGTDSVYISNSILPGSCYRFRINRVTLPAITGISSSCIVIGSPSGTAPSFSAMSYPSFQPLGDTLCVNDMGYFMVINPNSNSTYTWVTNFGNFPQNPLLLLFNNAGTAIIRLQENNSACTGPLFSPADTFITLGMPSVSILGPPTACVGDTVNYHAILQNQHFYLWSVYSSHAHITDTLNNQASFVFDSAGTYQISVEVVNACFDTMGYRTITVNPSPPVPSIIQSGDTLTCSVTATTYRWYKNNVLQPGLITQSIVINPPADNGSWQVTVSNSFNCTEMSAPLSIDVGMEELTEESVSIFPNPVGSKLTIYPEYLGRFTISSVEIYDIIGEKVLPSIPKPLLLQEKGSAAGITLDVSSLPSGIYFVTVTGKNQSRVTKRFVKL